MRVPPRELSHDSSEWAGESRSPACPPFKSHKRLIAGIVLLVPEREGAMGTVQLSTGVAVLFLPISPLFEAACSNASRVSSWFSM